MKLLPGKYPVGGYLCVCMSVYEREREKEREANYSGTLREGGYRFY